jgi:hypothetical protein
MLRAYTEKFMIKNSKKSRKIIWEWKIEKWKKRDPCTYLRWRKAVRRSKHPL